MSQLGVRDSLLVDFEVLDSEVGLEGVVRESPD